MANYFCSVFNVVCVVNVCPRCRSEFIDSACVVIVPAHKCIKQLAIGSMEDVDANIQVCLTNLKVNITFAHHFESKNYTKTKSSLQLLWDNNIAVRNTPHLLAIIPKRFSDMRRVLPVVVYSAFYSQTSCFTLCVL